MAFNRPRREIKEEEAEKTIEINAQMQGSLSFNDPVILTINGNFNGNLGAKGTLTIGANAMQRCSRTLLMAVTTCHHPILL